MRVLLLVQKEQKVILDGLYAGIAANCDCDTRWLTDEEQANLKRYFCDHVEVSQYDRIVLFLRFKKEIKQARFIRTVPNLVILEHDACQNYMTSSKYKGKFSEHYKKMPWARIIVSGYQLSQKLQAEGFDAVFVPKGYDDRLLWNMNLERDIELGFVGGLKNPVYRDRAAFLGQLSAVEPIQILQAQPGEEYRKTLNRIKFFVCPDIGMGEYMIKTFEAMACGCIVCAYDQGYAETKMTGLEHGHNILLFKTIAELRSLLSDLRSNEHRVRMLRQSALTNLEKYTWGNAGKEVVSSLKPSLRVRKEESRPLSVKFKQWLFRKKSGPIQ